LKKEVSATDGRKTRSFLPPVAAGLVLALSAGSAWGVYDWWRRQIELPYRGYLAPEAIVEIPRGSSVARIARELADAGVVKSAVLFRLRARLTEARPKAGTYGFDAPMTMDEVLEVLETARIRHERVTIPEGLDLTQVAVRLVEAGFGSVRDFIEEMHRTDHIRDLDPDARDLEGYLLPDTYFLTPGMSEAEIVSRMVANFRRAWTPDLARRAEEVGFSVRDTLTMASLIEKETAAAAERPLVSAVFHNRLRLGMRLMCDPTVIYAVRLIKEFDGIIRRSDLALDSPYNTYVYAGLPPGPIANPGRASIRSALFPAEAPYLYFVSRNDGTHVFSTNYDSHRRAVRIYQR
jgi:UPF0755 protein